MTDTAISTMEIQEIEAQPANSLTPMHMLDRAVAAGASIDTLERLIALKERYDATEARKAFDEAMSAVKAEIGTIKKSQRMSHNDAAYETLDDIAKAVREPLAKYGLSYRFETDTGESGITVTCIIAHRAGHSERNSLRSNPDTSGGKNSIQAIGSAVTYLQRYSLKAALGLAASVDDNGKALDGPVRLTAAQAQEWIRFDHITDMIRTCPTFRRLANMRDRLNQYTFLPPQWVATWMEEIDKREEDLDRALSSKAKQEEAKSVEDATVEPDHDSDKWESILWEFAEQTHGVDPETISELKSEYEPLLQGAPDEVWSRFNKAVEDAKG